MLPPSAVRFAKMEMNAWPENAGEKSAWFFRMEMEKESRLVLLSKVRLACEQLAAPASETVESLLRLVLGGGDEASPLELEAGLRSLGLCPTPLELQQLLSMFGVPCLAGAPNVDVSWLIDVVVRARVAPAPLEDATNDNVVSNAQRYAQDAWERAQAAASMRRKQSSASL